MRKRVVSFVLVAVLLMSLFPLPAYADDAAFRQELASFLSVRGLSVTDEAVYKWSTVISTMKADGSFTVNGIAGALGCWLYEAGSDMYAVEGYGRIKTKEGKYYSEFVSGGVYDYGSDVYPPFSAKINSSGQHVGSGGNGLGLAQWTWGREDNLTNFCSSLPDGIGYVTVSHNEFREEIPRWSGTSTSNAQPYWVYKTHKIPDLPGQVLFMLYELHGTYNQSYNIIEKMKNATTPTKACQVFYTYYEGGGSDYTSSSFTGRAKAAEAAVKCIEACGGVSGSGPVVTNPSTGEQMNAWGTQEGYDSLGASMVNAGYWSDAQLSTYCSLTEANLESTLLKITDRSNLRQSELESLIDWERNKDGSLKESGFIATLRWIVSLAGVLMTIWAVFVYLAFWFDHINSFFYMDALHLFTFGQLHICPPGDKPTFTIKEKVKTKTVSHWQIVCICMTAILFGCLLISGIFYTVVARIVYLIQGVLR